MFWRYMQRANQPVFKKAEKELSFILDFIYGFYSVLLNHRQTKHYLLLYSLYYYWLHRRLLGSFNITASEQFGTNLRATVTTSVPNFVRGAVPLINIIADIFKKNGQSYINSNLYVGLIVFGLAFVALLTLKRYLWQRFRIC